MSEEVDMNVENEGDAGVKVEHVDCSDAFNTSQFYIELDRSDTNTSVRGMALFLLIPCERSGEYRPKKNDLLRAKPVLGGEGWMVKLICGVHNHEMVKSFVFCTWVFPYKEKFVKCLGSNEQHDDTSTHPSFETSTHVVGHMFKVTLYKKLLSMVSRYALNEIVAEYERVPYAGKNPSRCGCVMRSTHSLPSTCELSKYVVGSIPLETIHIFWRRLSFSDQGLCEAQLDVCGKVHLKTKLREIAYPDLNSMCAPPKKVKTKGAPKKTADQTIKDSIENIIDVKADGNCGYRAIAALLGIGEESWSLVCNHLYKKLTSWSEEYINLLGGIERFEELKCSLLVDGLSMVTMDKWMNITDMRYVIVSRYKEIVVFLSRQQSITFFPLRSQSLPDYSVHRWSTPYIGRMQRYTNLSRLKTEFVDFGEQ
ncbi:hypothetical protein HKD37_05G013301 [Glycine soja]